MNKTRKALRKTQEVVTRLLLVAATVVCLAITTVAIAKMVATGFSLLSISYEVRYEENLHDQFMQAGEGRLAEECDQRIIQLYAERNELINSTDAVVAFAATHQFLGFLGIALFFGSISLVIFLVRNKVVSLGSIVEAEAFALRTIIWVVSLMITYLSYVIYVTFRAVMSQTKPKKRKKNRACN